MWVRLTICTVVVALSTALSAQNGKLELQLVGNANIQVESGTSMNVAVKISNNSDNDQSVSLKISAPQRWKCFSSLNDIYTSKSNSTVKILSFRIPSGFNAGNYIIGIEAFNANKQNVGELSLSVTVNPKYELNLQVMNGSEYVFANDTFLVQFCLQNRSNSRADIEGLLKSDGMVERMNFSLNADSMVFLTRKIIAEKGILKSLRKSVTFTVSMANMREVQASSVHFYTVIPTSDAKIDVYNRFPLTLSTSFVSDNPQGKRIFALFSELTGQEFLDNKNTKLLKFQFRGPDRRGKPLYGINDEYVLEYKTSGTRFMVGDNTYKLSYLTEYSRYGRGAQLEHSFNKISIGSFVNYPRFYPNIKRELAVYAIYDKIDQFRINIGYLNKLKVNNEANNLITINGAAKPFKWAIFDGEYAYGSSPKDYGQALKTELKINFKAVRLLYNFMLAEKGFPGYFVDTRYMMAIANFRLSSKIDVGTTYNFNHQNIALDTLYASAPFSANLFLTFNYRFMKDGSLSASYNIREQTDRMKIKKFDYNERSMMLIVNKRINKFGFDLLSEYGNTQNLLLPENERRNELYRGRLTLSYRNSTKLNTSGFVSYQESNRYFIKDRKNWLYGVNINTTISSKISLLFNFQSSYNITEYYLDRSLLDSRLSYSPNKNNRLEFSGRYSLIKNSLDVKELAYMFKFVHTFNVPISKKENIGKLSGRVINNGVGNVGGIILSLGSNQAITDQNGNYSFPMLPSGNYYMMIDYSKAGANAIAEIQAPYLIEIQPGIETKYDIGLTSSVKISGEMVIVKEIEVDGQSFAEIRNHIGKLNIEAKRGSEVLRTLTNEAGKFWFENLRPGEWTVIVYGNGIPNEYVLVNNLFNLNPISGETVKVEVQIKEKRRRIKFQKLMDTNKLNVSDVVNNTKDESKLPNSSDSTQVKKHPDLNEELEYRIQLGAYSRAIKSITSLNAQFNITDSINESIFNGLYIYTFGSFGSFAEAQVKNKELQKAMNITSSFVVSFRSGVRTLKLEK